jgi:hypothetical protein
VFYQFRMNNISYRRSVITRQAPPDTRAGRREEIVEKSGSSAVQSADLERFIYADVVIEQNGMPLSVLSALSRRGLDPWQEAERLSQLPRPAAADGLAKTLAGLPIFRSSLVDTNAVASRLVALLPSAGRVAPAIKLAGANANLIVAPRWMVLGMVVAVVAGLLLPNAAPKDTDTVAPASWFANGSAEPAKSSVTPAHDTGTLVPSKAAAAGPAATPAPSGR